MESIQKAVSSVMNSQREEKEAARSSSPSLADNVATTAKKCSTALAEKKDAAKVTVAHEADKASEETSCAKSKCESKATEVADCSSKVATTDESDKRGCSGSPCP